MRNSFESKEGCGKGGDMDKMGEAHLQESVVKLLVILLLGYVLQSGR